MAAIGVAALLVESVVAASVGTVATSSTTVDVTDESNAVKLVDVSGSTDHVTFVREDWTQDGDERERRQVGPLADLSGFDVGTIELTHKSGDEHAANVTGGENARQRDWNATATASDGQGNTDGMNTNAHTVDTKNLSVTLDDTRTVEEDENVQLSPASISDANQEGGLRVDVR